MALSDDIAAIARQEARLVFDRFDENTAWQLGSTIRERAAAIDAPLVIEIGLFHRRLFHAALPGTAPDNADWVRRKRNTVERFHRSSYAMGLEMAVEQSSLQERYGLPRADYAEHGGGVPIRLRGVGVVGYAAISGLPQRDDHLLVIHAMGEMLGVAAADLDFA